MRLKRSLFLILTGMLLLSCSGTSGKGDKPAEISSRDKQEGKTADLIDVRVNGKVLRLNHLEEMGGQRKLTIKKNADTGDANIEYVIYRCKSQGIYTEQDKVKTGKGELLDFSFGNEPRKEKTYFHIKVTVGSKVFDYDLRYLGNSKAYDDDPITPPVSEMVNPYVNIFIGNQGAIGTVINANTTTKITDASWGVSASRVDPTQSIFYWITISNNSTGLTTANPGQIDNQINNVWLGNLPQGQSTLNVYVYSFAPIFEFYTYTYTLDYQVANPASNPYIDIKIDGTALSGGIAAVKEGSEILVSFAAPKETSALNATIRDLTMNRAVYQFASYDSTYNPNAPYVVGGMPSGQYILEVGIWNDGYGYNGHTYRYLIDNQNTGAANPYFDINIDGNTMSTSGENTGTLTSIITITQKDNSVSLLSYFGSSWGKVSFDDPSLVFNFATNYYSGTKYLDTTVITSDGKRVFYVYPLNIPEY